MRRQSLKKMKLPDAQGVYRFIGARGKILYIGRATSLRSRVRSYFAPDIGEKRGPAISQMIEEAKIVKWEKTDSVLEALILEAILIKKYQPKYNVKEKDDKSFNYIVITKEDFPRVLLMRGRELLDSTLHAKPYTLTAVFGPFPRGGMLRDALKIIRKIFPFRDLCTPHNAKSRTSHVRPCFNAQIGLCPGVCSGAMGKKEYTKIIDHLRMFLGGKKKSLVKTLKREMRTVAKKHEFEKASALKRMISALDHIQDIALIKDRPQYQGPPLIKKYQGRSLIENMRIEGYDVAHISGKSMVGVMTVVENGEAERNGYRKFKIKTVHGVDDTASLAEVLRRRFGHPEWQYPRLIVVDGGVAQKNRAERVLKEMGIEIPVVSVVKDEHHRPRQILGMEKVGHFGISRPDIERMILRVNGEAHRFAIVYHKRTRARDFL